MGGIMLVARGGDEVRSAGGEGGREREREWRSIGYGEWGEVREF